MTTLFNVKRLLPESVKRPLRRIERLVAHAPNLGTSRYCPVCRTPSKRFATDGTVPREDARCMYCDSLERHRLVWLYFQRMTDLFDGAPKTMLHVAPEPMMQGLLKERLGAGYLTADLSSPQVMVRMDVTDIPLGDDTLDVIYCSHVLEHVPDDRRAMRELRRVLQRKGWAVLLVPISASATLEDPSVTDPAERARLFGQDDHVRAYGPDYVDRLEEAGFNVRVTRPADFLRVREIARMGITPAAGEIYCCTK